MRVADCAGCVYRTDRCWTMTYRPRENMTANMTKRYAWCACAEKRCQDVRVNECRRTKRGKQIGLRMPGK